MTFNKIIASLPLAAGVISAEIAHRTTFKVFDLFILTVFSALVISFIYILFAKKSTVFSYLVVAGVTFTVLNLANTFITTTAYSNTPATILSKRMGSGTTGAVYLTLHHDKFGSNEIAVTHQLYRQVQVDNKITMDINHGLFGYYTVSNLAYTR